MKNFIKLAVMSLFLAASLAFTMNASDPPENATCSAQCTALNDLGLNHGQCVSFCTSCTNNGNTGANCVCNFAESIGSLEQLGLSFGDCIVLVKSE